MPDERVGRHGDDDAGMGRLLRERLPRHPPPAHLRAAIVAAVAQTRPGRRWANWLLPPLASAFATALIMILAIAPLLPPSTPADPLRLVSQAVVSEHARSIFWGETRGDVVPAALPRAMQEGGVEFSWVFAGDDRLQLVNAQPTYLDGRRGVELDYRDADGHTITYIVLSARTLALPERGRVQIDRWRPLVRKEGGFSLILWKQQELLCVLVADLVSDADLSRLKDYFVKVRSSTEPYSLN